MFYVSKRQYDAVFEPAEGGYYVETSYIEWLARHSTLEEAYADMLEAIMEAEAYGDVINRGSWFAGFDTYEGYDIRDNEYIRETDLVLPWFDLERNGYIGSGYTLEITVEEPKDRPYLGYC